MAVSIEYIKGVRLTQTALYILYGAVHTCVVLTLSTWLLLKR